MLQNKIISSLLWSLVKNWGGRLTSLLVFMLLTRLLDAKAIGAVAFVSAAIAILVALTEMGLAEYLIYVDDSDRARNQIFWFQLFLAAGVAVLACLGGPALLRSMGQADAATVAPYLALILPLAALSAVQDALQRRALNFKSIAVRSLCGMLAGAVVGVGLALAGAGMWSLVFKQLTETTVMTALLWRSSDWRPKWGAGWEGFTKIFHYGRYMVGSRVCDMLFANIDDLLVGSLIGQAELGLYSIGKKLYLISSELLNGIAAQVAGPIFYQAKGDKPLLSSMFIGAIRYCAWLVVPFYSALYLFAPQVVQLMFGARWDGSAPILQYFCIVGVLFPLHQFNWSMVMLRADATSTFYYAVLRNLSGAALMVVTIHLGMFIFIMSQAARAIISMLLGWYLIRGVVEFSVRQVALALVPGVVTAALAVLAYLGMKDHVAANVHGTLLHMAVVGMMIGLSYLWMVKSFRTLKK